MLKNLVRIILKTEGTTDLGGYPVKPGNYPQFGLGAARYVA